MNKALVIAVACLLLIGCRLAGPPGDVEFVGAYIRAPEPVSAVELYLEPIEWEQRPYETIAHIRTDVRARDYLTMAEAEAAGYERLRFMAARSGALAVIDVEQWVTLNGEVVAVESYEARRAVEDYVIHMRAKAVRFHDQRR